MEIPQRRATGRTTQQMRDAPKKAIFVWCNDGLAWPQRLAMSLKRPDLQIICQRDLESPHSLDRYRGQELSGIVFDHVVRDVGLTPDQWVGFQSLRAMVRPADAIVIKGTVATRVAITLD